jgi:CRP-like cAMP-binding protein/rhodanese-related sulfurtransferase
LAFVAAGDNILQRKPPDMVNLSLYRQFIPIASLTASDRSELSRLARLGTYQPGQVLFTRGESAKTVVFLVSGEVELFSDAGTRVLKAETPAAQHPLAQGPKRTSTGTCIKPSQVLFVDREHLDLVLTWSQTSGAEVVELGQEGEDGQDWMSALLQSESFHRIPPGNIGQIFAAMQPVAVKAGSDIIRQGDPGDFYYVVTAGRCAVSQLDPVSGVELEVVQLGIGRAFGEEALISGNPRNATVKALTDCALMRLAAVDFTRLLRAPIMREIGPEDVPHDAVLIDVRLPQEFRRGRLPDSINVPLNRLRDLAAQLDAAKCYVVYCDSGRRSASATFLLCERGFDARLLTGGVPAEEMPIRG